MRSSMVSRFREAISAGHNGPVASVMAARQAGRTLLISASTVAIGFFIAPDSPPFSEIRSIGCRRIPGGGNQCAAYKYPRSGGAGTARPADRCWPDALYSDA